MSKAKVQEFEYKTEMKQLLHLIVHSLYTHPEVFLRELISNASDALNKVRFRTLTDQDVLDPKAKLEIKIELDEKKQLFSIEDSGIGMSKDNLINEIGTVAKSGTLEFLKNAQENKQSVENMIGQFGVGFYSVFMVTENVTIETRHADNDSQGLRWTSDGQGTFSIEEIEKKTRGTKISFKLKDDYKEFAQEWRVKNVIQKYSNFVDFPIHVGKEQVNKLTALWQKQKSEMKDDEITEFYKYISNDFEEELGHLHLSLEGTVNFKALIFIPKKAPMHFYQEDMQKGLQLYSNRVFIQDDAKEILPEYLRFVKGVVDTEDLPLNVSREWTQNSPIMAKISNILVSKILGFLEDWSKKEPEKFKTFHSNFGPLFKMGVNSDFTNRDKIINLLRFESTMVDNGNFTSLADYVSRMGEKQKDIYYLSGENKELIKRNPNLEYFKKNDLEVLLLTDPVDVFIVPSINEFDKKPLKSIEKADLELEDDKSESKEKLNEDLSKSLIEIFKETLGDSVEDVIESKRLVDSVATLVSGKEAMDSQMEKMMKHMGQDYTSSKKILEINLSHPLIKNLSRLNLGDSKDPMLRKSILHIYEGAKLLDGNLDSPSEFIKRMTELMEAATK